MILSRHTKRSKHAPDRFDFLTHSFVFSTNAGNVLKSFNFQVQFLFETVPGVLMRASSLYPQISQIGSMTVLASVSNAY